MGVDYSLKSLHRKEYNSGLNAQCVEHIYIDFDLPQPHELRELIKYIDGVDAEVTVHIHILSYGGFLDTALYISRAIKRSKATFIAEVQVAGSGATLIALSCDSMVIDSLSVMIFHKFYTDDEEEKRDFKTLFTAYYEDFLSPYQFNLMDSGSDVWVEGYLLYTLLSKKHEVRFLDENGNT